MAGFIATIAAVAVAVTWWSKTVWTAPIMMTVAITGYFSLEAETDSNKDGLWPIGAMVIMVGAAVGIGVVCLITAAMRKHAR